MATLMDTSQDYKTFTGNLAAEKRAFPISTLLNTMLLVSKNSWLLNASHHMREQN